MKTRGWKIWPCPWVINKIWQNGHIHFVRFWERVFCLCISV